VILSYAQDSTLISFKLKDQFNKEYTEKDFLSSICVFVGSDKGGSEFNGLWAKAIHDSLQTLNKNDQINIVGISDLRGVPFFLKGFVKGKFPKEKERWVLMDWKGKFQKAYQFHSNNTNILIFDDQGNLVLKEFGRELERNKLNSIITQIINLISG
jgi:hypothetical protein